MRVKTVVVIVGVVVVLGLAGCAAANVASSASPAGYRQVTQQEAQQMMDSETGYAIVDVRTQKEFASGHVPGAICVPNESIGTDQPSELPDLDQLIMVYCRSGNRSKQAAAKLADMGYTNVVEFGGINTWPGEVVTD